MPSAAKWDDLRIFLEVARQGSVHAASKRLKLDHSTVTRRIGKLESLLSVKLLDRSRKGIAVREEAQALLKHIEQMDMHANSLEDTRHAHGQRVNANGPHRDNGRACQSLSGPVPAGSFAIRTQRKDRARQHPANGRSHAKRSRHIPELLQSKGARAKERPVRQGFIVSVLLARLRAPTRTFPRTARISRSTRSLDTSTICWPFTPSDGWTRLSPSRQ